ncbi:MAG: hypothetical protein PVG51_00350 [Desulfosarcina sp.]|jgi:hypothetical protein
MNIRNLDINILFYLCDRLQQNGDHRQTAIDTIFEEFSDIPESEIISAIRSMTNDRLIAIDKPRSRLSVTEKGVDRLRSSVACRINPSELCACIKPSGSSFGSLPSSRQKSIA